MPDGQRWCRRSAPLSFVSEFVHRETLRCYTNCRATFNLSHRPFFLLFSCLKRSRRGGGGGMSRPAAPSRSTYSKPATTPARSSSSVPAPMQSSGGGGMLSGIGSTIAQGMAFGTGSAMAHRAVGAVAGSFGGSSEAAPASEMQPMQQQQQMQGDVCAMDKQMFFDCLQQNKGDQESCRFLYDQLQQCQQNQTQFG